MKSSKQEKKYKQYLKLIKEYNEVVDLIRKEPLIELEEPYQDGWILSYRLSDNISCSKLEREELEQLIKDSYSNSYVRDVRVIRCIRSGKESFKKRKKGDFRSDEIIKKEIYDNHIKDNYNVLGVFDDRLKVIRMWEKEGLFVFNCNQGNIEF